MSEAKEIWEKLSVVDCNDHKEKKGKFDYLPWNWAWSILMEHYPEAEFRQLPDVVHTDQSVTVNTEITIGNITRPMWLAVTDLQYDGIPNPSSDEISDTRMRCFTKNMAMFGLGYYIYQGEGVPRDKSKTITSDQARQIIDFMRQTKTLKSDFCKHFGIAHINKLPKDKFEEAIYWFNKKVWEQGGKHEQR